MSDSVLDGLQDEDLHKLSNQTIAELKQKGDTDPTVLSTQAVQELRNLHHINEVKAQKIPVGQGEAVARGYGQGLSMGFMDEASGALSGLKAGAKSLLHGDNPIPAAKAAYHGEVNAQRDVNSQAQEQNPWTYGGAELGGNVVGGLGIGLGGGVKTAAGMAAEGTVLGGVQGAGYSEGKDADEVLKDTRNNAIVGGIAGGVLGSAAQRLSKFLSAGGMESASNKAAAHSVAKGKFNYQYINERYPDGLEGFGKDLKKLKIVDGPLGSSSKDMLARSEALRKVHGGEMGAVLGKLDEAVPNSFNPTEVQQAFGEHLDDLGTNPVAKELKGSLSGNVSGIDDAYGIKDQYENVLGHKNIPLQEGQNWKSQMQAKYEKQPLSDDPIKREGRQLASVLKNKLDEGIQSAANTAGTPEEFNNYLASRAKTRTAIDASDILEGKVASEDSNRWNSLTDHGIGGLAALMEQAKGASTAEAGVKGILAAQANKVLRNRGMGAASSALGAIGKAMKFGGDVSEAAINAVAQGIKAEPQAFGKYRTALEDALRRGPQSLAITHFMLMKDPNYRDMYEGNYQP